MLLHLAWYSVVSFFAVYGAVQLLFYLWDFFYDLKVLNTKVIYTVVPVKNEEQTVEGIAKALLWKAIRNDSGIADSKIVVLDMGSEDGTKEVIQKLEAENKGIFLMEAETLLADFLKSI